MAISIIIPVYNVAAYLRECLESVLAQTCPDWEAICIDDGSTDESPAILDEYAAKDKRFRVFHQQNAGVSAARNKGLDEAQGEHILIIDADDKIVPELPMRVIEEMQEHSLDFCLLERHYPWETSDEKVGVTHEIRFGQIKGVNGPEDDAAVIEMLRRIGMSSSGIIYRREFLQKFNIRYPKGIQWNEDFVFVTMAVLNGARFGVYDEIGYLITSHQDSLSHHSGEDVALSTNRSANMVMGVVEKVRLSGEMMKYYAKMNKRQIFCTQCKETLNSLTRYNAIYRDCFTLPARILNKLVILFPCLWFGRFNGLRFANRVLEHFGWYYK